MQENRTRCQNESVQRFHLQCQPLSNLPISPRRALTQVLRSSALPQGNSPNRLVSIYSGHQREALYVIIHTLHMAQLPVWGRQGAIHHYKDKKRARGVSEDLSKRNTQYCWLYNTIWQDYSWALCLLSCSKIDMQCENIIYYSNIRDNIL